MVSLIGSLVRRWDDLCQRKWPKNKAVSYVGRASIIPQASHVEVADMLQPNQGGKILGSFQL